VQVNQIALQHLVQSCYCGCLQAASEQRPHKLSYHLDAKGDAAEQVLLRAPGGLFPFPFHATCSWTKTAPGTTNLHEQMRS
jgi:hypothetical protein